MKLYNKHSKLPFFTLITSILLASSCSPSVVATVQPTVMVTPYATLPVIAYTSTPAPTQIIIPTPTSQPTLAFTLKEECLKIEDQVPSDLQLAGLWAVGSANPYLEDIGTGKKTGIPLDGTNVLSRDFGGYAVSPNREWFAYIDQYIDGAATTRRSLRVINSSGKSLPLEYWAENFQWIIGWADDNHIALELNKTSVNRQKIVILNPFTGDHKDITPAWIKDFHKLDPYWLPQTFYSPDASRAIVVADGKFELRDVQSGKTVFQGEHVDILPDLAWSPDSSKLAITDDSNRYLYIIDKNKNIIMLEALYFDAFDRFWKMWWSPDGKKLLFSIGVPYVFDLESGKITKFCFEDKISWTEYRGTLWSPNNKFIVIDASQYSDSSGWLHLSIIIDIDAMRAYKLPRKPYSYERLAWLATP